MIFRIKGSPCQELEMEQGRFIETGCGSIFGDKLTIYDPALIDGFPWKETR
jgi:hypothetical protein